MFDIGFSEIALIAVVALIVLGPERLPKAARTVGALLRRARASWQGVKNEIERELAAEDLKRSLADSRRAADIGHELRSIKADLAAPLMTKSASPSAPASAAATATATTDAPPPRSVGPASSADTPAIESASNAAMSSAEPASKTHTSSSGRGRDEAPSAEQASSAEEPSAAPAANIDTSSGGLGSDIDTPPVEPASNADPPSAAPPRVDRTVSRNDRD